jgi:hypothetical protein
MTPASVNDINYPRIIRFTAVTSNYQSKKYSPTKDTLENPTGIFSLSAKSPMAL